MAIFAKKCSMKERSDGNIVKVKRYVSPCGDLLLGSFLGKLCLCDWRGDAVCRDGIDRRIIKACGACFVESEDAVLAETASQLAEYFAGAREVFDIPILFIGTEFQRRVWREISKIPYGNTVTYGELSKRIGAVASVRAVANACGANALSIIVPCHRVVGAKGKLTGYAGGIAAKRWLLCSEQNKKSGLML